MRNLTKITSMLVILFVTLLAAASCSKKDNEPVDPTPTPSKNSYSLNCTGHDQKLVQVTVSTNVSITFANNYASKVEDTEESQAKVFNEYVNNVAIPYIDKQYTETELITEKVKCSFYNMTLMKNGEATTHSVTYYVGVPLDQYAMRVAFRGETGAAYTKVFKATSSLSRIQNKLYAKGYKYGTTIAQSDIEAIVKEAVEEICKEQEVTLPAKAKGAYYDVQLRYNGKSGEDYKIAVYSDVD